MEHGITMLTELVKGLLRLGIDALGGDDAGALTKEAAHPYGLRSRPRDPTKDPSGIPSGAGLLVLDRGGGDEAAIPTQDPRITTLTDEGKGGAQLYGWTGTAIASVVIDGATGMITITPASGAAVQIGGAGGEAIARAPELQTWATAVDIALSAIVGLLNASAGPVMSAPGSVPVTPPLASSVAASKGTVV